MSGASSWIQVKPSESSSLVTRRRAKSKPQDWGGQAAGAEGLHPSPGSALGESGGAPGKPQLNEKEVKEGWDGTVGRKEGSMKGRSEQRKCASKSEGVDAHGRNGPEELYCP